MTEMDMLHVAYGLAALVFIFIAGVAVVAFIVNFWVSPR